MTLEVDVRDLLRRPGASRTVDLAEPVEGLRTEMAFVPDDRPVSAQLLAESVVEGVLASGCLRGSMVLRCARCLSTYDHPFRVDVQELFAPAASATDEQYPVVEGFLDLEPMIRDAVVLSMPLAPLCKPGCLGLCSRCGGDRNVRECTCPPEADSRWAPLSALQIDQED